MISNAEIKHLAELKERSGRIGQKRFFIEGKRSIEEALAANADIKQIIVNLATNSQKFAGIYSGAEERGIRIEEIPAEKFNKLSSTETSQGIIAVAEVHETTFENLISDLRTKRKAIVLILDRISDPGNLGTILRSAAWFGVDAVLIAKGSVDVYNPKVVRSAMAAIAGLNFLQEVTLVDEMPTLKKLGFTMIASTQNGNVGYTEYEFPKKAALVFGSEATGITQKVAAHCDESIFIPRVGKMESLNVAVATSIVLAEVVRQRSASGQHS